MQPRYIYVEGRPVINPAYQDPAHTAPSVTASAKGELPIVSNLTEQAAIAELTHMNVPQQFQDTMAMIQSQAYIADFQANDLNGAMLVDGLMHVFAQNEIPIGLITKLTPLRGRTLHFKIDDSTSMREESNLLLRDACNYTKQIIDPRRNRLTRWEEAEDRMHTLMELLAFVPTGPIILSFFDRPHYRGEQIVLDRHGKLPGDFLLEAHASIRKLFSRAPNGNTPILLNMQNMLNEANAKRKSSDHKTMHYLLTDGEPNDGSAEIAQIKNLLLSKERGAAANPFTFLGCSNKRADYAWMHEVEEVAPFVASLPDYRDALAEVKNDQGSAFPYPRGFWLLCNVAASINPDDLDALSKHTPLTKVCLENLMGRGIAENEYRWYFDHHPLARRVFAPDFAQFLTSPDGSDIRAVQVFLNALKQELSDDMDHDNADTEAEVLRCAEKAVHDFRIAGRPVVAPSHYAGAMFPSHVIREPEGNLVPDSPCFCNII